MTEWIGIIGVFLGSLIGAGVTFLVTHLQHKNSLKSEARRRKLDAFESIHLHLSEASFHASTLNMHAIGDLAFGNKFDASKIEHSVQPQKLQMLVDFYAPFLSDDIKAMNTELAKVVAAVTDVIFKSGEGEDWVKQTILSGSGAAAAMGSAALAAQKKLAENFRSEIDS